MATACCWLSKNFPATDTVKVTQGVEAALAAMQPGLGGMEIDSTVFRPATFIRNGEAESHPRRTRWDV